MHALFVLWIVSVTGASPGPLSKSHETVSCASCHNADPKSNAAPDDKCKGCHTATLKMHATGRFTQLACETCHLEHKGAAFDITAWNTLPGGRAAFDHDKAGWTLAGKHAKTACSSCHTKTNRAGLAIFRGANPSCLGCHTVVHANQWKTDQDCDRCHSFEMKLATPNFDHDKTTFPLGAAHKSTNCAKCHTTNTTKPPSKCETCHATKSPHGTLAMPCSDCHAVTRGTWRAPIFDHAKRTRFPLTAKHGTLACRECHTGKRFDDLAGRITSTGVDCLSCHPVHDFKYKNTQCLTCHTIAASIHAPGSPLLPIHGASGTFPLVKAHKDVACIDCHKARDSKGKTSFANLVSECGSCHADIHKPTRGTTCSKCHQPGIWK